MFATVDSLCLKLFSEMTPEFSIVAIYVIFKIYSSLYKLVFCSGFAFLAKIVTDYHKTHTLISAAVLLFCIIKSSS
jgi:hypothetical protein